MPETTNQISFAKLEQGMEMPHLLDIQTRAFEALLQLDAASHDREDVGLERVFKDLFPITDVHENFSLEFVRYSLGEPKYSVEECIERDMTYSAPLKATLQLVINEEVNGVKRPRNIIEKEVYLGELPLLTDLGTFVISGAERVIVSQLHRSPGVVFEESTHPNGQRLISARIIPFRGSWVEFTVDIHDVIYVHIDKKKKFPATALLRAFGYGSNSDILRLFFAVRDLDLTKRRESRTDLRELTGAIIAEDITLPGEVTAQDAPKARTKKARAERERLENEYLVREGDELTDEVFNRLRRQGIDTIKVFASYTTIDLRDEQEAIERGERPVRRTPSRCSSRTPSRRTRRAASSARLAARRSRRRCRRRRVRSSRCARSTACCARATRRTRRPRAWRSSGCSSAPSATTSVASAATRSTSGSASRLTRA